MLVLHLRIEKAKKSENHYVCFSQDLTMLAIFGIRVFLSKLQKKLQCCQNKMFALSPRTHLDAAHFQKLNWLVVSARVGYLTMCHMFNCISGTAPKYLQIFNNIKCIHQHSTRYSQLSVFLPESKMQWNGNFQIQWS